MPKVNVNADELIEKLEQFSEENSDKTTLQQILTKLNEQSGEIAKLNKKITDLETGLKEGKYNVGTGGSSTVVPPTPSIPPQNQTSGGDSTSSKPNEAQQKEKA